MIRLLTAQRVPISVCSPKLNSTLIRFGAAIAATIFGLGSPAKAADLDFSSVWTPLGDVKVESPTQINLSSDGLFDDDFDLDAGDGDFNFSGKPAAPIGFKDPLNPLPLLEEFLGISATKLDVGGSASEGSAIKITLSVSDRSELSFDWNFLTNETADALLPDRGAFNDYGFFLVGQEINKLADWGNTNKSLSCLSFDTCTGVQKKTYLLNQGEYTLAFGVIDIDDFVITSALSVSNVTLTPLPTEPVSVPEPNLVFGIFAVGGLGVRLLRTNKK